MKERAPHLSLEEKHYRPEVVEAAIYELWEKSDIFRADNTSSKKPYTIVIPPPNVTGRLHMGHALNNTLQDVLIRYKRMDGYDALWVPGTDHAGISTQSVVKKHLDAEGIHWKDLGREKMVERIWEWKTQYGDQILMQLRRLGCSCDWSRTRFTMDEQLSLAVRTAFKHFYDADLIYRGKYIVNWCPVDHTALSDEEVLTKDGGEPGHLWYFRYPLSDGSGHVEIATTRPETMLGDTAVAVNPKDSRFSKLIGQTLTLPLVGREIPIIADDFVDPQFGTGCVKVTPAHDPNDFQMGLRHDLAQIDVMNEDATMSEQAPAEYQGLDRYECREKIIAAMKDQGFFVKTEARMVPVGRSYRSKAVIEYRLSDQWFVKMQPLAQPALAVSEADKLRYSPERWDGFYRNWLRNTRDWCISRQLWWGHRIPAWYHKQTGEIVVDIETPKVVQENPADWYQDEDVLDTWFSSALWPYSTLGWPEKTADLERYYPTDVLVTAKDIIFFWVSRMVMTGLFHMKEVPFHTVLINSIICDEEGDTMSKSKGNGIDPLHVIDGAAVSELEEPVYEARPHNLQEMLERIRSRFPEGFPGVGADALRYTMLTTATDAQQVHVSLKRFEEVGRSLTNKLWNAGKLVLGFLDEYDVKGANASEPALEDRWLLSRLDKTVQDVREAYDAYNFHLATSALYHFFWDDLCDWYLEIAKSRLRAGNKEEQSLVLSTLSEAMHVFLRLLHPIMPFITEELWGHLHARLKKQGLWKEWPEVEASALCAVAAFPHAGDRHDAQLEHSFALVQEVVRAIRNMRAHANVSPKNAVECSVAPENQETQQILEASSDLISRLSNLKSFAFVSEAPAKQAVSVLSGMRVYLNLAQHMDVVAEITRNESSLAKLEKTITGLEGKLANEGFVSKAPKQVVDAERGKLSAAQERKTQVLTVLEQLRELE